MFFTSKVEWQIAERVLLGFRFKAFLINSLYVSIYAFLSLTVFLLFKDAIYMNLFQKILVMCLLWAGVTRIGFKNLRYHREKAIAQDTIFNLQKLRDNEKFSQIIRSTEHKYLDKKVEKKTTFPYFRGDDKAKSKIFLFAPAVPLMLPALNSEVYLSLLFFDGEAIPEAEMSIRASVHKTISKEVFSVVPASIIFSALLSVPIVIYMTLIRTGFYCEMYLTTLIWSSLVSYIMRKVYALGFILNSRQDLGVSKSMEYRTLNYKPK